MSLENSFNDGLECRGSPTLVPKSAGGFLNNLEWRRAVKHFGNKSIDTTKIIEAIVAAPSSFGLQPYKVIAVRNPELKEKLRAVAYNQTQVTECDTLFVFCSRSDIELRAEEYINTTGAETMRDMLTGFISYLPDKLAWATRQTYIALGFALAACAELQIPSCPMEGFSTHDVNNIIGLPETLSSVVMLAVGSPAENDGVLPRFRFPKSNLIEERN
jgi:nitroreductase/dihydropteridine reductase